MRKHILIWFISGLVLCHSSSLLSSDGGHIKITTNLQQDSKLARQYDRPILLMVSQQHCPFCDQMKREILQPMQLSGEYEEKIVLREILIDLGEDITNFQGRRQNAAHFAHDYGVHYTPTLLLLNPEGKELTKPIVGINTVDMFNFYLDAAIDQAIESMTTKSSMKMSKD